MTTSHDLTEISEELIRARHAPRPGTKYTAAPTLFEPGPCVGEGSPSPVCR